MTKLEINDITLPISMKDPSELDALYARLRKDKPVAYVNHPDWLPFWALTKAKDIIEVESKPEIFLCSPGSAMNTNAGFEMNMKLFGTSSGLHMLLSMDPPQHMVYRNILQSWFTPGNISKLQAKVKEHVKKDIDDMTTWGGKGDFADRVAKHYPLRIILEIMGFPPESEDMMLKMTEEFFGASDPEIAGERKPEDVGFGALQKALEFYGKVAEDRRKNPRDDVSSLIANAKVDGELIPHFELLSYFHLIFLAGHDTTSSALATSMLNLIKRPELLKQLKSDPSLIPAAVEEFIRFANPVKHFFRTPNQDYVLSGQKIKAGEHVALLYQSACFDEEYVEDPYSFRIDRVPNRHLAFGYGPHKCLGQHLARLELISFFQEFLPRIESIEQDGPALHLLSNFVSGVKNLPIKFKLK